MRKAETNEERATQLVEKLKQYPELQERFKRILSLVENEDGTTNIADEADLYHQNS